MAWPDDLKASTLEALGSTTQERRRSCPPPSPGRQDLPAAPHG